eukprot:Partr_v1_DN26199_c0_g1_i3_m10572 putative Growth arrest-specific 8
MSGKGASAKKPAAKGASAAEPAVDPSEKLRLLEEELKKERQEKAAIKLERDKIQEFWEIEKRRNETASLELAKKDHVLEKVEEDHQDKLKQYKQKIKHLLFEYQTNLTRVQADADSQVDRSRDDHFAEESELRKQVRTLKVELKELELSQQEVIKNLKFSHEEKILKASVDYDRKCKDLYQKYTSRSKAIREELEFKRKIDIHEIEERKNMQISALVKNHDKAFAEMKGYFNDITLNNLALINTLREQLEESKKAEERNERLVNEISMENKKLKDPLESAMNEGDQLKRQLMNYEKDQTALKNTKARLKQTESQNKQLTWTNDILSQRLDALEKESAKLKMDNALKLQEMEQKLSLKTIINRSGGNLKSVVDELSQKSNGSLSDALHSSTGPKSRETSNETVKALYKELMTTVSLHNGTVNSVREYLDKYSLPAGDLPLKTLKVPQLWLANQL